MICSRNQDIGPKADELRRKPDKPCDHRHVITETTQVRGERPVLDCQTVLVPNRIFASNRCDHICLGIQFATNREKLLHVVRAEVVPLFILGPFAIDADRFARPAKVRNSQFVVGQHEVSVELFVFDQCDGPAAQVSKIVFQHAL